MTCHKVIKLMLIAAALLHGESDGLMCWVCRTDTFYQGCGDPLNPSLITEKLHEPKLCNDVLPQSPKYGFAQYCTKAVLTAKWNNASIILRNCVWGPADESYKDYICDIKTPKPHEFCDACSEDGCNGCDVIAPFVFMACTIGLIHWFMSYL